MAEPDPALTSHFRTSGIPLLALADGGATPLSFVDPVAEHLATRNACGLFDFSFMGTWEISGPGAKKHLTRLQTRDLSALVPGQLAYTLMCRDDGSIFNDATVWMLAPDEYLLFSGRKSDAEWIASELSRTDVSLRRVDDSLAVLALQGPNSGRLLAGFIGEQAVRTLGYFRFADCKLAGVPCRIARLGYSGELGYEIVLPASHAPAMWQALLAAGGPFGIRACGFAAANSLRIESGYILFSHELLRPRLPAEVGLARLIDSIASSTRGFHALSHTPVLRRMVCLELDQEDFRDTLPRFELTSSAFSPLAGKELALGFTDLANTAVGTVLRAENGVTGKVCGLPWYDPDRLRPRADPLSGG